jgi:hypothetical protein
MLALIAGGGLLTYSDRYFGAEPGNTGKHRHE